MLNNLTNFLNIITGKMIKKVPEANDLIPLGTRDSRYGGSYKPTAITVADFIDSIPTPPSGLSGVNYTYVSAEGTPEENGGLLVSEYAQAILETPNGLPLSETNRYTILLAPAIYKVDFTINWNTNFIDLACIDGVATLQFQNNFNVSPIVISANDTKFSNIKLNFAFLENNTILGFPILLNKSKVLLNNCSGYFVNTNYSEEYTIDRDYQNTTVSRRILQNCLNGISFFLGLNYVDLTPNSGGTTQFFWSETTNLFAQSRFDIGAVGDSVLFSDGNPFTIAALETQTLPLSDKYITMQISNLVGTFSLNDVVTQGGTTGVITETDGISYFYAYVATGVFPNGTGTITNTTSGGTADNNGWSQNGNSVFNSNTGNFINGNNNFINVALLNIANASGYIAQAYSQIQFSSQMYILYEGANTSFAGATVVTNELGGTATPVFSTNAGEVVIANLVGTWLGATQIWNDLNPTPVTITARSQNIIHTLNKTVTNR